MKMKTEDLRRFGFAATLTAGVSALAMAVATPALAQDEIPETVDEIEEREDTVVVVGSRIQRKGFEDISQPALVVDAEVFDSRGFVNVADALNEIPGFGAGVDGITTGSGQNVGQNFLDLFDLGTQRTLVVVNGRRFVPGNPLSADPIGRVEGSQVDINNFNPAMIERVEVLSIGGAPIYGADAIAGTINLVLRDDFEGVSLSGQYGDFFDFGASSYNVSGLIGANFADGRGNVTASIQYQNQEGAVTNDVPGLANQLTGFANGSDPSIVGPEGRFNILEGPNGFLPGPTGGIPFPGFGIGVFTDPSGNILTFDGTGGLTPTFDPGTRIGSSSFFFSGGNGFDLTDFQEAIVPTERFVFSSTGHYRITDNIRAFFETNFLNSSSADLISQAGTAFNTAFLGAQGQGAFALPITNPFISDADRQTLIDAGAGETIFLNGINLGLLPNAGANFVDTTTFRVVGGLQGNFEAGERNFNWEVSMNFGRTDQSRNIAETIGSNFFNAALSTRLDAAQLAQLQDADNVAAIVETVGASGASTALFPVIRNGALENITAGDAMIGDIICSGFLNAPGAVDQDLDNGFGIVDPSDTATPSPLSGCVPVNLFVGALPTQPGSAQAQAIDYISGNALSNGEINQTDFLAFISGDLFELPAGWIQATVGYERRKEFGSLTTSGFSDGFSREPAIASFPQAEVLSNELFGEMVIPVLNSENSLGVNSLFGFDFLSSLVFEGSYRHIRPSADFIGDDANALNDPVNTFSAGGRISFLDDDLTFRGNFTRSVRQPSIVELASPAAQAFDQTGDPCDNDNIDQGGSERIANCIAAARAAGFTEAAVGDGFDIAGNPDFGLILAPGDDVFNTPSVNAAVPLLTGGNPLLTFEISNSWTAGFIYQPSFVPNLTIGADYISINLRDAIAEPDFSFFTQTCFDDGLDSPECENFTRSPIDTVPPDGSVIGGFDIVAGRSGFANSETFQFQALQGQMRYNFDVADAVNFVGLGEKGDLGAVRVNTTFFAPTIVRDSTVALPLQDNGLSINTVGSTADPELQIVADFGWKYRGFDLFWRSTYFDNANPCQTRISSDCSDIPDFAFVIQRDVEHDMSVGYELTDYASIRAGVNNILDNEPTLEQQAFGGGGNVFGRSIFFRLNIRN